ncbi:MAG: fibronectin type III domain-containing protein, partial [Lentisphaerae bacterium]|nr:fibronectin type III domain-containing protein [Lentisphaerota bacterium]
QIAVLGECSDGTKPYKIITATTEDEQNSCTAPVVNVTGTSADSISLSWNATGINSYTVYYNPSGAGWKMAASGSNSTSYVITGLTADTSCQIAVLGECSDGTKPYKIITATTEGSGGGLTISDIPGQYIRQPPTNDWHTGIISAEGSNLKWTNNAGYSWTLVPDIENEQLLTTGDCPYGSGKTFALEVQQNGNGSVTVTGFRFGGELYSR